MSKKNSLKRRKDQHEFELREAKKKEEAAKKKRERKQARTEDLNTLLQLGEKVAVSGDAPKRFSLGVSSGMEGVDSKLKRSRGGVVKVRKSDERRKKKSLKDAVRRGKMVD
eukprot:CAMPEP_0174902432 /NCGR_PEP_ID=MMETSP0167-20121228/37833_1 /TAXON_ID=38298 /ORGANISM="Rhodella maculata, Strain CCMP736" /LENGTH=110 /DNA_ID=CAMNT_0016144437 /DNA_START=103 /DNA_END=435 /DNA_ORIENTATION=+